MAQSAEVPPEGRFRVSEIYATIQGESSLVGYPTVFVRLYTCNLRCAWCDSMHAVEGGDYREVSVDDVGNEILRLSVAETEWAYLGISHVCWTGGEPMLQWKSILRTIERLRGDYLHTIETDGEVDLGRFDAELAEKREKGLVRFIMDIKCPGSGMTAKRAFENLGILRSTDEVKFVLANREDYEFAKGVLARHPLKARTVLFSPVTPAHKVKMGLDPATLASWILEDRLDVRLQLQVHKYVWPGKERGI